MYVSMVSEKEGYKDLSKKNKHEGWYVAFLLKKHQQLKYVFVMIWKKRYRENKRAKGK